MSKAEIAWFTPPVGDAVGYGYAAVETIRGIQNQGVKVSYQNDEVIPPNGVKSVINFVQPDWYRGNVEQFRVGYTPWESTVIPEHWIPKMRQMDEIWTPCNWIADIYNDYGVNDVVRMVPHGIDPEVWRIENRFLRDKFVFLHVGGPTHRKGGQRVVDAFLKLFDGNTDYALVLKSNGPSEARVTVNGKFCNAKNHPQISVIDFSVETHDLVALYNKAHCLVYPTNGEGFGLIPFQGISTGLPTIVTNATACADYAEMSIPLDSKPTKGYGIHLGDWVEPDFDDLCDKMLYVVDNFEAVKEKTIQSAKIIHTTQTWDHVGKQIVDILGDKIYEKI